MNSTTVRAAIPRLARFAATRQHNALVPFLSRASTTTSTILTAGSKTKAVVTDPGPSPQLSGSQHAVPSLFDIRGRVFAATGGGGGLTLCNAEYLAKHGAHVYCLDYQVQASQEWAETQARVAASSTGSLSYIRLDTRNHDEQEAVFAQIADKHNGINGLIAGAGVNFVTPAVDYPPQQVDRVMDINFKGVFYSAQACGRQMIKYKTPGSIVLIASMSARVANRGLFCSVYNASKAAVDQLSRSLAAEWSQVIEGKPIRVNSLCPGNIITPMVLKNFADEPHLKAEWEYQNMMGRLSTPDEYNGAMLYLLSDASSFKTGASEIIDGGYTAW
ncbi:Putative short-chain dehydrogenase/reductase SDR, NAD(P)-binding domain superfamily [Septoria linicola]|uniref:Short-chain dehydrogenase/reductase SDR, NAD(P)-binding domain superfamily n=1 Tax=Septoria linicola TaxID=215465 RepID=A0A9Q9AUK5_9PEZI|nr:putative short-chain dehydrogenase/reductase SDR, NAD(P)-binding domain superfamily [Septoria linicola]USW55415.1 Putative short-chain dehydrogenase/reductase SDR, NAD(P)-binding domain superfamily [Septoria linicola]